MRVVGLVSGGKDSWYALHVARDMGWEIAGVLTVRPADPESHMYHHPNTEWVAQQAEAAELPHRVVDVPRDAPDELGPLQTALVDLDADGFVSGAVASEYQRTRLERIGEAIGRKSFAPLWHKDPLDLLRSMVAAGFDARFVHVAADGLDASWLGRRLEPVTVHELEALAKGRGLHATGEGGEYETFVLDAPMFRRRLVVGSAESVTARDTATWRIGGVDFAKKSVHGSVM